MHPRQPHEMESTRSGRPVNLRSSESTAAEVKQLALAGSSICALICLFSILPATALSQDLPLDSLGVQVDANSAVIEGTFDSRAHFHPEPVVIAEPNGLADVVVESAMPTVHSCESCGETAGDSRGWLPGLNDTCRCGNGNSAVAMELAERRRSEYCPGFHPRLQLRVGAVYMTRVNEKYRVLIQSTSNPLRQLNAEDFDFGWEPGLDASASHVAFDDSSFEVRFLGLRQFTANQFIETDGSEVRFDANPDVFAPNVQTIDSRYTSDLYSLELNWHYVTYCPFNYIAGFRYVGLDEDLGAVLDAAPQTFRYRSETNNDLYGIQLGVESAPDMPLFGWHCLSWYGKVGIYGNDTRQRTVLDTTTLGQIVSESPDTSAVLWEFGVGLDLPVTHCLSIQGGYGAMIFERVTIASDQLRHIDFINATGSDNRGTTMYHGANLALVYRR